MKKRDVQEEVDKVSKNMVNREGVLKQIRDNMRRKENEKYQGYW